MNTSMINRLMERAPFAVNYQGTFALDKFKAAFKAAPYDAYIFNTHTSDKPGEHWLATIGLDETVYFFDSYGFTKKRFSDIQQFITDNCSEMRMAGSACLQGVGSTTCGDYCVVFLLLIMRGWSCERFYLNMLRQPNSHERDHQIRLFIKQLTLLLAVPQASGSLEPLHVQLVQPFCDL